MRSSLLFLLGILLLSIPTVARDNDFGVGIVLGEPTGLCFKAWTGRKTALDGAIAWSFGDGDAVHFHADYLIHDFRMFQARKGDLVFYYGFGGRIKAQKDSRIGVRIPIGISYIFERAPVDIFLELAPGIDLSPSTDFWINGSVGIRYYF
ncbi:MAG: hypothetical protein GTO17_02310 [Candidatus Aminicenantes bacterium]|nr:hypothetical protein [Candidatus Aminicenantes bacterium]